jgi:hypothetical protein
MAAHLVTGSMSIRIGKGMAAVHRAVMPRENQENAECRSPSAE